MVQNHTRIRYALPAIAVALLLIVSMAAPASDGELYGQWRDVDDDEPMLVEFREGEIVFLTPDAVSFRMPAEYDFDVDDEDEDAVALFRFSSDVPPQFVPAEMEDDEWMTIRRWDEDGEPRVQVGEGEIVRPAEQEEWESAEEAMRLTTTAVSLLDSLPGTEGLPDSSENRWYGAWKAVDDDESVRMLVGPDGLWLTEVDDSSWLLFQIPITEYKRVEEAEDAVEPVYHDAAREAFPPMALELADEDTLIARIGFGSSRLTRIDRADWQSLLERIDILVTFEE